MRGRTALVDHVDAYTAALVASLFDRRDISFFQIRALGGAVKEMPADATAYAHRAQNFSLFAQVRPGHEEQMAQWRSPLMRATARRRWPRPRSAGGSRLRS
ncbi:hypothetical protein OG562_45155 [Streptomyces sp. NBC_01275]|uniref:hypothetical protein n=1 Tax=Streptomyces sp. NBC_01275 TaxID=2903807 RepID=UPI0022565DB6|nr:hypothetical protein [Streptomyces sp. NBC_01275]MCX4768000.1 hypothetical protein [Streptomyces sp. NBC_01275]